MKTKNKHKALNKQTLAAACRSLTAIEPIFAHVHENHGTPPLWDRPQGFATLLYIILEQQVSLASARACYDKLTAELGTVEPNGLLKLNDAELKTIGFSRQKTAYARHLAEAVLEKRIDIENLPDLSDAEVKSELTKLKGVGDWTSDIYLLMAMLRPDIMPKGDLALHAAWQKLTNLPHRPRSDEFLAIAERWKPFRSTAARLLWHYYLAEKKNGTQINTEKS